MDFMDVLLFFAFQLPHSAPGLNYRCIVVKRAENYFQSSFLSFLANFLNSALAFFHRIRSLVFPENFVELFSFVSLFLQLTTRAWGRVFFYHWYERFWWNLDFFYEDHRLELFQILTDFCLWFISIVHFVYRGVSLLNWCGIFWLQVLGSKFLVWTFIVTTQWSQFGLSVTLQDRIGCEEINCQFWGARFICVPSVIKDVYLVFVDKI